MKNQAEDVIIVGAGLAGLACARRLMQANIPFLILESDQQIGGRLKTDNLNGFILNHGFQVLQTAYPEARRVLDFGRLDLKPFAPGVIIRTNRKFYRIGDPRRLPRDFWNTLTAPIGTLKDRLRIILLAMNVCRGNSSRLFHLEDTPTFDFLQATGFSEQIIQRFFKPFFAGVCLDPEIKASSRVFRYIFRTFTEGTVALPSMGMAAIAQQLSEEIPLDQIRTGTKVKSIQPTSVIVASGESIQSSTVVLATDGPETARLAGTPKKIISRGEWCLYYKAKDPPINIPYLILNGEGTGCINSMTVLSSVSPTYAPARYSLVSVVVLSDLNQKKALIEKAVRQELTEWFGLTINAWQHLNTYRISHALPEQPPPMPDPARPLPPIKPGLYVCGEYDRVPGIQWALLSGRQAAEQVIEDLKIPQQQ